MCVVLADRINECADWKARNEGFGVYVIVKGIKGSWYPEGDVRRRERCGALDDGWGIKCLALEC